MRDSLAAPDFDQFSYFAGSNQNAKQEAHLKAQNNNRQQYQQFSSRDAVTTSQLNNNNNNNRDLKFKPILSEQAETFNQYHQQHSIGRIQEYPSNYPKSIQSTSDFNVASNLEAKMKESQQELLRNQQLRIKSNQAPYDVEARSFNWNANNKNNQAIVEIDERCQRRSLGKLLQKAKNLLTDGFTTLERSATAGNLIMLGSSVLAAAIPLAAYILPDSYSKTGEDGRRRAAGNNNIDVNANASYTTPTSRLQGGVESIMGWVERSVEHLPNFPRLHPQECVKRSICEAHNDPERYGAIGFMLRLLFPATNLSVTDRMDNMEFKVINKYRHAAGYGFNKRMDNNGSSTAGVCKQKYEDCLVSLLDVSQNLMDVFLK